MKPSELIKGKPAEEQLEIIAEVLHEYFSRFEDAILKVMENVERQGAVIEKLIDRVG